MRNSPPAERQAKRSCLIGPERGCQDLRASLLSLLFSLLCVGTTFAHPAAEPSYTKHAAVSFVLDDYCRQDCAGYLETHSGRYRRTFRRALNGDVAALKKVFADRRFHSGDNEWWEPVPGSILFVVGDKVFSRFVSGLNHEEQRWALMKIPIAAPFHDAFEAGNCTYFKDHFPLTYRLYFAFFPEFSEGRPDP